MNRLVFVLLAVFFPAWAFAEQTNLPIPGEVWQISFDSPPLSQHAEARKEGVYAFRANSGRFNISLFVERPAGPGMTHNDPYKFYWSKASQNPRILKESITSTETAAYVRVQYDVVAEIGGKRFKQKNINYYSAFRGKWIDVHISIVEPTKDDESTVAAFDKSLRYGDRSPTGTEEGDSPSRSNPVPDNEAFQFLRDGSLYYMKRDYKNSIGSYSKALELEKKRPTLDKVSFRVLIDNLGIAYAISGDLKQAKETFEYGITKDGEYPMFYYNLACTYAEMNDMEGAITQLKNAFQYRDNQNPGERMPDPTRDDSFQRFMTNERFTSALREIMNKSM